MEAPLYRLVHLSRQGGRADRQTPQIGTFLPKHAAEPVCGRSKTKLHHARCAEKVLAVEDSLSIVVPVRDAQSMIEERLHYLLDVVPELTSRFEIIVVDDASQDHTAEIVNDLTRQYPQLKLVVHQSRRGLFVATKTGLAAATGETIFVHEDMATVSANHLRRLWSLRNDRSVIIARTEGTRSGLGPELIERLSTWGQSLRNSPQRTAPGGIQMIRRDGAQSLEINSVFAVDFASRKGTPASHSATSSAS
jgi:cellulose synthase/poly-beta-1,6-N-acetylglucosamine synthase-like glycosyltransferase